MRTCSLLSVSFLCLALGGCAVLGAQHEAAPTPAGRGHEVALRLCAACHAVEPGGVSPQPRAPAFASREMQHTAGLDGRVEVLTRQGHYGMAPVALSAQQVDDVVAYVESLGERDAGSRGRAEPPSHAQDRPLRGAMPASAQADEARSVAEPTLALGRALVVRNCGLCHAVGRSDESPRPGAPAFRDLSQRYDVEALGEALAEGILTGHPEMPEFRFAPSEVEAILRYLQSIQVRQRGARTQETRG